VQTERHPTRRDETAKQGALAPGWLRRNGPERWSSEADSILTDCDYLPLLLRLLVDRDRNRRRIDSR